MKIEKEEIENFFKKFLNILLDWIDTDWLWILIGFGIQASVFFVDIFK